MNKTTADLLWVTISAGLVFLMQGGFLCLETGLTRSKNNINVAIKNLADFGMSTVLFWLFGFALMFGASQGGCLFVCPRFWHWVWNGLHVGEAYGWLGQLGFVDFAGSTGLMATLFE